MRKYGRLFETEFAKTASPKLGSEIHGVKFSHYNKNNVDEVWAIVEEGNELNRNAGNYITFSLNSFSEKTQEYLIDRISTAIRKLCNDKCGKVLILGMGNSDIISDALGVKTLDKINLLKLNERKVCNRVAKFCPGVFAVSGFHSYEIVSALNSIFLPDTIIVVDSLCAGNLSRLGNSFQVTDAGITPGSAVGDNICNITSLSMGGAKVISIGVPVVIYLQSVLEEATQKLKPLEDNALEVFETFDGIFSPKEIDEIIDYSSNIISRAIKDAIT